jgi:hypothetical protein
VSGAKATGADAALPASSSPAVIVCFPAHIDADNATRNPGKIQIGEPPKPAERWIEITSAGRLSGSRWVGQDRYFATYRGELLGEFRVPECEAVRWLLANGHAAPNDTLIMCRDGRPALTGSVGWLADRTVEENDEVSARWRKFRPFLLKPSDGPETVCGESGHGLLGAAATLEPETLDEAP